MTKLDELRELRDRLQAATGPDRELDAVIAATLRYPRDKAERWERNWEGAWVAENGRVHLINSAGQRSGNWAPKPLTASLDASVALVEGVLPGWRWTVTSTKGGGAKEDLTGAWIWLERRFPEDESEDIPLCANYEAEAATPPLAVLIALFKALIAEEVTGVQHD